jgi:hypothetical protein
MTEETKAAGRAIITGMRNMKAQLDTMIPAVDDLVLQGYLAQGVDIMAGLNDAVDSLTRVAEVLRAIGSGAAQPEEYDPAIGTVLNVIASLDRMEDQVAATSMRDQIGAMLQEAVDRMESGGEPGLDLNKMPGQPVHDTSPYSGADPLRGHSTYDGV